MTPEAQRADAHPAALRAARLAVAVIFFVNGAVVATWAARIPAVQKALALTPGELGVALLGAAAGALATMNLAGYLAARAGSRPVTVFAALCLCAVFPLLALAPNLPLLFGALVLYGAANGSMDVAMNTQGVTVERGYKRPILTSFHALFSLGGLAGAFAGGVAAAHRIAPLPHFLGAAALAALAVIAVSRFLLPARADAGGAAVAFARPTRGLLALGLVAFCVVLGEGAMADWSAVYLAGTVRAGAGLAASGYAAFSLLMALGRLGGDRLAVRLGPARLVRSGGLVSAAGLALALAIPWAPTAVAGFALVGAGFAAIFPLTVSAAGRTASLAPGTAVAAVATCGYAGFLVGPPAIGFVADALGLRLALGIVAALCLLIAVCAAAVRRDATDPQAASPGAAGA